MQFAVLEYLFLNFIQITVHALDGSRIWRSFYDKLHRINLARPSRILVHRDKPNSSSVTPGDELDPP